MRGKVCPTSASVGKQRCPGKYCRVIIVIIPLRPRDQQKKKKKLCRHYHRNYIIITLLITSPNQCRKHRVL